MVFAADYPFLNIFWTMIIFFCWVVWIWMMIAILGDVFGRRDISGWGKAAWTVFMIVLPFIGVLAYLITNSHAMAERKAESARAARSEFDEYVKNVAQPAGGGGAATDIAQAKQLLDAGTITESEFGAIKAKALA